jgi:hypothetical protein
LFVRIAVTCCTEIDAAKFEFPWHIYSEIIKIKWN